MKKLLFLLLPVLVAAQTKPVPSAQPAPAKPAAATSVPAGADTLPARRKTMLLAAPAPATPASVGPNATPPPLPNSRISSQYELKNGRVTGGSTTIKLGKKN